MDKRSILNIKTTDNQIAIFYLGQMGFLLKYQNTHILIDGYLTDYVDRTTRGGQVKWIRRYAPPITPEELDFLDYVFCTHDHIDHADPDTLAGILSVNSKAKFVVSSAITDTLLSCGVPMQRIIGMNCRETLSLSSNVTVSAIPAAHEELHPLGDDCYLEVGFRFSFGGTTLYHAGDCCPYDGLEHHLSNCDVMIMPVNGRDYFRTQVCNIIGCFTIKEAALLARKAGAQLLIPAHFDLYDVNCISPVELVDGLYSVNPQQPFHIFKPGERYIFAK